MTKCEIRLPAWVLAEVPACGSQREQTRKFEADMNVRRHESALRAVLKPIEDDQVSTTETIPTEAREGRGSQFAKRLRAAGKTPAVVYGHGHETITISVPTDKLVAAVGRGAHVVKLEGVVNESALMNDIQWDALGSDMLHVDFTRVDAGESAQVELMVELRGVAPGTKVAGVVEQNTRSIVIECPVLGIPDKLQVSINELELDGSITADKVALPEGAKLVTEPGTVIVSCSIPVVREEEEEAALATGAEPDVIGAKPDEGESSE